MTRAQIDKRIFIEHEREGLMGPWLVHRMRKDKRLLRRMQNSAGVVTSPRQVSA